MEHEPDVRRHALHSTLENIGGQSDRDSINSCVICLDPVSEKAVANPCQHDSFDFICLVSWLQENPTCPLCKSDVRSVDYHWRSPTDFKTYPIVKKPESKQTTTPISRNSTDTTYRDRPWRSRRHQIPRPLERPDTTLFRRRQVYRDQTYSSHVGTNRLSRFQDLTPEIFTHDEELISRGRKWIRRELQVFEFLRTDGHEEEGINRRANNAEFLLEYIVAILKTVDVKGSGGQAEDMLQEFLGRDNTKLFLHELRAWLRSPYSSLEDWDRHVQYPAPYRKTPREENARTSTPRSTIFGRRAAFDGGIGTTMKRKSPSSRDCSHRGFRYHDDSRTKRRLLEPCIPD